MSDTNEEKKQEQDANAPITVINQTAMTDGNFDAAMKNAEKFVKALDRMRQLALASTSIVDWRDENGKPYLQWTGAAKVARAFGVSFDLSQLNFLRTQFSDENGEAVRIRVLGNVRWNGSEMAEIGASSSRDDFFGKRTKDGKPFYLPLSEIDETDIEKKALTNWLNRGLKSMLGLSFTWEEIEQLTGGKITLAKVKAAGQSTTYSRGKQGGASDSSEVADVREKMRIMVNDMAEGNADESKAYVSSISKWKDKDGNEVAGKDSVSALSEKQITFLSKRVKDDYVKWLKSDMVKGNPQMATFEIGKDGALVKRPVKS